MNTARWHRLEDGKCSEHHWQTKEHVTSRTWNTSGKQQFMLVNHVQKRCMVSCGSNYQVQFAWQVRESQLSHRFKIVLIKGFPV